MHKLPAFAFHQFSLNALKVASAFVVGLKEPAIIQLVADCVGRNLPHGRPVIKAKGLRRALGKPVVCRKEFIANTLSWVVLLGATETNPLTSRESRVNVASVYGYSLLFATFVSYLSSAVAPNLQRPLFSGLAAFLIAAMIVNRVHVQYEYGRSWDITKEQLRQIVDETPEATSRRL